MDMRYRLPELMDEAGFTAYRVAQRAKQAGRPISTSTISRIVKRKGRVGGIDPVVAEALLAAFGLDKNFNAIFAHSSEPIPKRLPAAERKARRDALRKRAAA